MRKRRFAVKLAIGLAVAALAIGIAVPFRADAAWLVMTAEVAALRAEVRAVPPHRDVLWGEPSPGDARVHWARATAAARTLQQHHHAELLALLPHSGADITTRHRAVREAWQPVLAALRAGAAAADCAATVPGEAGRPARIENLLDCRWVANAAVFEARALRQEGRHREAVQCTLDAAALSRDLLRTGVLIDQMIGCATLAIATTEAWPEPALDDLDDDALALLATGLARLDTSLPAVLDDRVERLFLAAEIERSTGDEQWLPSFGASWRFGFSTRWMLADAFLQHSALARRLAGRTNAPWPERLALWERESAATLAGGNPVLAVCLPNLSSAEGNWREQLGALRLLRGAIELHRGNPMPKLLDPIAGQPIAMATTDGAITLTCASTGNRPAKQRVVRR